MLNSISRERVVIINMIFVKSEVKCRAKVKKFMLPQKKERKKGKTYSFAKINYSI